MMAQIHQPPPPLEVPGLPLEVRALVMRCLEKEPRRRFNDTAALMVALRELDWAEDPLETGESTMWDLPPPVDLLEDETRAPSDAHDALELEPTEVLPRAVSEERETLTLSHYRRMLMGAMFLNAILLALLILLLLTRSV